MSTKSIVKRELSPADSKPAKKVRASSTNKNDTPPKALPGKAAALTPEAKAYLVRCSMEAAAKALPFDDLAKEVSRSW